jgi:hypothetical protein
MLLQVEHVREEAQLEEAELMSLRRTVGEAGAHAASA